MGFVLKTRKLVIKQTGGSKSYNNLKETIDVEKFEKLATGLAGLQEKEAKSFQVQEIYRYE